MQTTLLESLRETSAGREAEGVLRKCVHCGFCLATCPTYQLVGDELDSPRGRIYLIKQVLEGKAPARSTQLHLDRCLTCRACETTCPSGVEYHWLLDTGRALVDAQVPRKLPERLRRFALRAILPRRALFGSLVAVGRMLRWLLPAPLRRQLIDPSPRRKPGSGAFKTLDSEAPGASAGGLVEITPAGLRRNDRRVLMLQGCVQPALRPRINAAAARVLRRAGITAVEVPSAGCCGALRFHLGAPDAGRDDMRRLIDAWWPHIEGGVETIVITASGCGAHIKDYGRLLRDDPAYAGRAARVSELARDLAEVVEAESAELFPLAAHGTHGTHPFVPIAFQSPCTLQHGQQITGAVELLLKAAGYALTSVADAHLCCGSAGTYSILQPQLARQLRAGKLSALSAGHPAIIATANIGCLTHLAAGSDIPIRHWIELLDERLNLSS
jgi:glycolate oxidase iron-sulfur subunit